MITHEQVIAKMLEDPEVKYEYEHPDIDMILAYIKMARQKARLTQAKVAERMKTKREVVARLESRSKRKNPSIKTLASYVKACGGNLEIKLSFAGTDMMLGKTGK